MQRTREVMRTMAVVCIVSAVASAGIVSVATSHAEVSTPGVTSTAPAPAMTSPRKRSRTAEYRAAKKRHSASQQEAALEARSTQ
jgi:hypothetical protein